MVGDHGQVLELLFSLELLIISHTLFCDISYDLRCPEITSIENSAFGFL